MTTSGDDDTGSAGFEVAARRDADATRATALAWMETLTSEQRSHALWAAPSDAEAESERVTWFYTPTDHGGLPLNVQSPHQQSLAMQLLASGMSRRGYATVASVIGLENVLDLYEGWQVQWARERGRDPGLFWLRLFGHPDDRVWGWRFAGHHVSVNLLIIDGRVAASTPSFIGTDPASADLLGSPLRILGGPEDAARALLRSLDPASFEQAVLHPRAISDIVSGNRARVRPGDTMMHMQDLWRGSFADPTLNKIVDDIDQRAEAGTGYTADDHEIMALPARPRGISARDLNQGQRTLLRDLIAMYTGRAPEAMAASHLARYLSEDALDDVHFGWAGSSDAGAPHYYRLHGPHLLVEYDNTQRNANHAHSVWRDPVNDFGLDLLAAHRRRSRASGD